MQQILVLSDTHSYLDPRLIPHVEACDQIWHGGDWGSVAVADTLMGLGSQFTECMEILMTERLGICFPKSLDSPARK